MNITEKIQKLINSFKGDDAVLDILKSDISSLGDYVNSVYLMKATLPIIRFKYEGKDLRYHVEKLDHRRRDHHERVIVAVKRINRFAKIANLDPIYDGNEDDRYAIAEFCSECVNTYFENRTCARN